MRRAFRSGSTPSPTASSTASQRLVAEFFALTFIVAAASLGAGMLIRGLGGDADQAGAVQPVRLMKIDTIPSVQTAASMQPRQMDAARPAQPVVAAPVAKTPDVTIQAIVKQMEAVAQAEQGGEAEETESAEVDSSVGVAKTQAAAPTFDRRPLRKVRQITMTVTAYSPDARSCGASADGITASGYSVWTNGMKLVAADTDMLPFGTVLTIPGYNGGRPVPVLDRGGAIQGKRLDVLYPTHERALQWGVKQVTVTVWEYAD